MQRPCSHALPTPGCPRAPTLRSPPQIGAASRGCRFRVRRGHRGGWGGGVCAASRRRRARLPSPMFATRKLLSARTNHHPARPGRRGRERFVAWTRQGARNPSGLHPPADFARRAMGTNVATRTPVAATACRHGAKVAGRAAGGGGQKGAKNASPSTPRQRARACRKQPCRRHAQGKQRATVWRTKRQVARFVSLRRGEVRPRRASSKIDLNGAGAASGIAPALASLDQ
jgi:hypothetical protein